jgi:hypothetical protein
MGILAMARSRTYRARSRCGIDHAGLPSLNLVGDAVEGTEGGLVSRGQKPEGR